MPKHSIGENDNTNTMNGTMNGTIHGNNNNAWGSGTEFLPILTLSPSSSPRHNLNKTQKPRPQTPKFLRLRPQQKLKKDETNLLQANPRRLP